MTDAASGCRGAEPFHVVPEPEVPLSRRGLAPRRVATVEHPPVDESRGCLGLATDADERGRGFLLP